MGFKTYFIIIYNISRDSFFDSPLLNRLCKEGVSFDFAGFKPTDPDTAITFLMTGYKPGNTAYQKADAVYSDAGKLLNTDRTLPFILSKMGLSIASFQNAIPYGAGDFCFVSLDGLTLLDKVIDNIRAAGSKIFIVAPVFNERSDKAVNVNSFLKKLELIETDNQNNIVWENSLAHHAGYGHLWVNLIGRDLKGTVLPGDEYEDVRNALIVSLSKKLLADETGEAVIDRVYKKEELFSGDFLSSMPDLVVSLKNGYGFAHESDAYVFDEAAIIIGDAMFYSPGRGMVIADNINTGLTLDNFSISSVLAVILYCIGEKVPKLMADSLDNRIFSNDYMNTNPPRYYTDSTMTVITEDEENAIKDRLRGLGYLD